jgi:methylated-DNA-[protein]-cysteine S-methyltransferase
MYIDFITTPIGILEIKASERGITHVIFTESAYEEGMVRSNKIVKNCKQQLEEYFEGKRSTFNFPLAQQGTVFQQAVWACLLNIPFGQVASYQDIANGINNSKAVRAVGAANGKNPIAIIVPCHRIIGSNGSLTGYAGGLERKSWLLKHEGIKLKQDNANHDRQAQLFNE